jgi:hypothetical protein
MRILVMSGGVLLILAAIYLLAWEPMYGDYRSTLSRIDLLDAKLDQAHRRLQDAESLSKTYRDHLSTLESLEERMFKGERPSLVGAEIQKILSEITEPHGVSIRRTRMLQEEDVGPYREVRIKVEMDSSITSLSKILHELSSHKYLFLVPEFQVSSSGRGRSYIRVDMTVSGLMKTVRS